MKEKWRKVRFCRSMWVWKEFMGVKTRECNERNLTARPKRSDLILWQRSRWPCPHCKQRNPCLGYRTCLRPPSQEGTESISILLTLTPDTQPGVILQFCSAFERIWSSKSRNGGSTLWHSQGVGVCTAPIACPPTPHPPGENLGNCQKSRSQTYL